MEKIIKRDGQIVEFDFDKITAAIEKASNATVVESAHISDEDNKEISFNVNFEELEKYYTFTTDIKNVGSIPGKIKTIDITGISDSLKKVIVYDVTYTATGKKVNVGDYIGPNSSKNITITVRYQLSDDATDDDIPSNNATVSPVFTVTYENGTMSEFRDEMLSNKLIKNKSIYSSSIVDFNRAANANDVNGLYLLESTKDDTFPIYFYRGGSETVNNHVIFAGFCWRIIRTTDAGGIKLIYSGVPNSDSQCPIATGIDSSISSHSYGGHWNWGNSSIKPYLDGWFVDNLNDYRKFLDDVTYCNNNDYSPGSISLDCSDEASYSVSNGKSVNPIGLITAQESNLCGLYTSNASYGWLNGEFSYWTMSGNGLTNGFVGDYTGYSAGTNDGWWIGYSASLSNSAGTDRSYGVRPVVAFNSEVEFVSGGDGTRNNPYVVQTN